MKMKNAKTSRIPARLLALAVASLASLALASNASAAPGFGISFTHNPSTVTQSDVALKYTATVSNLASAPDPTSGTTIASLELPDSLVLVKAEGSGWSCSASTAVCTSTAVVTPGASFPPISYEAAIVEQGLDSIVANFSVSGGGGTLTSVQDVVALAPPIPFELIDFFAKAWDEAGDEYFLAGGHPYEAAARFEVPRNSSEGIIHHFNHVVTKLPTGFAGNPESVPAECGLADLTFSTCPEGAAIGEADLRINFTLDPNGGPGDFFAKSPVYKMKTVKGSPAAFAFEVYAPKFYLQTRLRGDEDYGITVLGPLVPQHPELVAAKVTLCSFGAKTTQGSPGTNLFDGCRKPGEIPKKGFAPPNEAPLLSNTTKCAEGPPVTRVAVDTWENPGKLLGNGEDDPSDPSWYRTVAPAPAVSGCEALVAEWTGVNRPSFSLQPDNSAADTPAGYTARLQIPQPGLRDATKLATSHLRDATVTLPQGLSLNPSIGDGILSCSLEQMGLVSLEPLRFDRELPECPDGSKVGNVRIQTPLLPTALRGSIFLAEQGENPFNSDYAIYLAVEEEETGVIVKLAGEVVADPQTGQLRTRFTKNPELPFEELRLEFFPGGRAALVNPATCGAFTTQTAFTPWSAADPASPQPHEIATPTDTISVVSGPDGTPCSATESERPFELSMTAGSETPLAGAKSPFNMRITRPDGAQEITELTVTSPPGYSAYLRGIPACGQDGIASARGRSGLDERESPSCPASSRIGSINSAAGAGATPLFAAGEIYLGGPYKGAPLSLVTITPALAGAIKAEPAFDLGNVVVQVPLYVNRQDASIIGRTDAIPEMLRGIPLRIRDIRVSLDRPGFGLNPTSCDASSVEVTAKGDSGATANLRSPFQVGGCSDLAFKPRFRARLLGKTKRGGHPTFLATVKWPGPEGYANTKDVQVTLPRSAFLDQAHIRTICTRVQAAANTCPPGSIYGFAEAETPLLDGVLKGPVYLKSSDNKLPDLAIKLRGPDSQPVEVEFQGRIDSVKGQIRDTIEGLPDVPVTRFTLRMQGGKKGLLVNSRDLCKTKTTRVAVRMVGQNSKRADSRPLLRNSCPKKKKRKAGKRAGKR
jgi:hypothetical protein